MQVSCKDSELPVVLVLVLVPELVTVMLVLVRGQVRGLVRGQVQVLVLVMLVQVLVMVLVLVLVHLDKYPRHWDILHKLELVLCKYLTKLHMTILHVYWYSKKFHHMNDNIPWRSFVIGNSSNHNKMVIQKR
jgi:hypothetical protein